MVKICICGGGALGHVCAGVLSTRPNTAVNILTRNPDRWSNHIVISDCRENKYDGNINLISNNPKEAIANCNIVLLCLPGFAIEQTLQAIKPYVTHAIVGSIVCSTGFFFSAHDILGTNARLFGFQRVPFIARITRYGNSANLLGYKPQLAIAVENIEKADDFRRLVETLWQTPTKLLASHYEVSLTNSNPILHTGRLYTMWHDWHGEKYNHNILFYKEWTDETSQLLIDMDSEFMNLLDALPVTKGAIPSLLDYYESYDATSLTHKISNIEAFQNIIAPMTETADGWIPDFKSRYFTEDFPFGLRIIVELAHELHISTPNLDKVYNWGCQIIQRETSI